MNINLRHDSRETIIYRELLDSFSLVQHVCEPTHIKGGLLDHIITKAESPLAVSDTVVGDLISDHNAIACKLSIKLPNEHVRNVSFRKISDINIDDFKTDITKTNVYRHHRTMDLNDLVKCYTDEFNKLMDLHAPLVTRQLRTCRREPWFNADLRNALRVACSETPNRIIFWIL